MSLVGVRPDHDTSRPAGAATALRTTTAVRERAQYLLNRARAGDSPWFPGFRVHRQLANGDWNDAFNALAQSLKAGNTSPE